jgi:hypothetical protein
VAPQDFHASPSSRIPEDIGLIDAISALKGEAFSCNKIKTSIKLENVGVLTICILILNGDG